METSFTFRMALRVLLADNSETIKKVIQLTLQDFAAEVRSVNVGIDVIDVARQYKPDIIFADILLQKRNGYEVCQDIKALMDMKHIPVVLMWSGFMDLDQAKAQSVRADATLEKPFDSTDLRNLVVKLVPRLQTQSMAAFLDVPEIPKSQVQVEPPPPLPEPTPSVMPPPVVSAPSEPPPAASANWNMDSFEDIGDFQMQPPPTDSIEADLPDFGAPADVEDFAQVPIAQASNVIAQQKSTPQPPAQTTPAAGPAKKSANEFELDVPDETDFDGVTVSIVMPIDEVQGTDFLLNNASPPPLEPPPLESVVKQMPAAAPAPVAPTPTPTPVQAKPTPTPTAAPASVAHISEDQLEDVLKNVSRETIEKIVWKLVPDMAERIIRDEIKRLLDDPKI